MTETSRSSFPVNLSQIQIRNEESSRSYTDQEHTGSRSNNGLLRARPLTAAGQQCGPSRAREADLQQASSDHSQNETSAFEGVVSAGQIDVTVDVGHTAT